MAKNNFLSIKINLTSVYYISNKDEIYNSLLNFL